MIMKLTVVRFSCSKHPLEYNTLVRIYLKLQISSTLD